MKHFISITLSLLICLTSFAQIKVPQAVMTAFTAKFPAATHVKWSKENKKEYESAFLQDNIQYSANFKDNGEWLETETKLTNDDLPAIISTNFYEKYGKENKIKSAEKVEKPNKPTHYHVKANGKFVWIRICMNENGKEVNE